MKVYTVFEEWDNLESYEDWTVTKEVIGIASTEEIALKRIDDRISHLMEVVGNKVGASFEYKNDNDQKCLTILSYSYGTDGAYTWKIELHEIDIFDSFDRELCI